MTPRKTYTLCDLKCSLHQSCARYQENIDRTTTDYFDPYPFKNNKCNFYEELTEDDIIERVTDIIINPLKPK